MPMLCSKPVTAGPRVLLVDDDAFAHRVVTLLLEEVHSPIVLEWAPSFDAGLTRLLAGGVDVCLLDFQLGERSGLEFLEVLAASGLKTPVVMMTAQADHALDVDAMRAGAVDFLVKGEFGAAVLERVVRYALERSRTLEKLRESEERYSLAISGANDGIWDWKIGEHALFLSARWKQILGFEPHELSDTIDAWFTRVHGEDLPRLKAEIDVSVAERARHLDCEVRMLHRDGNWRWVQVRGAAVRDRTGRATRMAGSLSDVTSSRSRDPLTGLANRVLYLDRLEHALVRARRDPQYRFAVLFLDCDRFKVVNDSLGHTAGDELLVSIARRLEKCTREVDTVARFGGDEFAILLDDAREPDGASRVAERIIEEVGRPYELGHHQVFSGASVGIALFRAGYQRPEEVLRDADIAMYRAKQAGRGRVALFDEQMHTRAMTMLQLESDLRRAVATNQLVVHYQPIVNASDQSPWGFEALVRWNHPSRGLVPPDDFIPLAEETGVVVAIDLWVLEQACAAAAQWRRDFPKLLPTVSVNASGRQLDRPGAAQAVLDVVARHHLPPSALHLEVTETVVMNHPQAVANLSQLRAGGVHVVMDDFGTGYSSLANLHRLPFSSLKIDRSFVKRLGSGDDALELIRAIVTLGRGLKLEVAAEGVERASQLEALQGVGCKLLQGFLFSKAVPAAEATAWLGARAARVAR